LKKEATTISFLIIRGRICLRYRETCQSFPEIFARFSDLKVFILGFEYDATGIFVSIERIIRKMSKQKSLQNKNND